ncbi:SART-1 family protein DOT2 [Coniochaeta hoffmannii]|uniref:SART-1 family protein DOT2 n=1 Tax=Coniochaeta hoffmannii TaxID=91930 RepID=A0AA38RYV6_9PEZI|nr:SART-1 family protein DOT2 [Coniochaeta hoffmannii]
MDVASIEEINKLRKSMGMKPLPVPGKAAEEAPPAEVDEDAPSTLESRQAQAYDNFKKAQEAEAARKKREERAAAVKKAREKAQRFAVLEGKGLAELDEAADLDAKSWLKHQKKRQKEIAKARKLEEEQAAAEAAAAKEYTSKDLTGIKVGHDVSSFLDGDEQVLTLKDTNVLDESADEDELENLDLREQEKLKERLELKKKKPIYDPNDIDETGERGILSHYDEDQGKKKKLFKLDVQGTDNELADILDAPAVQRRRAQNVDVDMLDDDAPKPSSDYLDPSEIKVKKTKKKKSRTTRQRPADDDEALFPVDQPADQQMDVDTAPVTYTKKRKTVEDELVDDEDLQSSLARQRKDALKKRKKTRPEDIARQLREETAEPGGEDGQTPGQAGGMTLDEITGFMDTLVKQEPAEERRRKSTPKADEPTTAMADESDEDEHMKDATVVKEEPLSGDHEVTTTGVDEEESVSTGMAGALKLLRGRGLLKDQHGAELNEKFRQKELFLAELHRRMAKFDEETRIQRERDRASGRLDRMSARDREEWQRQQNTIREQQQSRIMDQLYKEGYKPNIELKYTDEHGRSLDQKEAFKHLSHQFHGKGSGKGKTDKMLKKIENEKRREAQSMLDASQNVGMSSAHAQQLKKRREAGVRLA